MGVQPGILAAALTVSIAQRLVRKLCPICKKQIELDPEKQELIRTIIRHATAAGKDFASYNINADMPIVTYGPVGCDQCHNGFKGRLGLYEAILTDDTIATIMTKVPPPTERDIKRAAEHQGIFTMIEDGVIKILTGVTSFDEIQGVVDLSEDVGADEAREKSEHPTMPHQEKVLAQQPQITSVVQEEKISPLFHPENNSGEEVALLVDYLKLLESTDHSNNPVGASEKIARVQHMILSILENTPNLEGLFVNNNPAVAVKSQIESLVNDLHDLEIEQQKNPSMSVAEKLGTIRSTIENMTREVV